MNKILLISMGILISLSFSLISCKGNTASSTAAQNKSDSGLISQKPDTSARQADPLHKASAITDPSWNEAAKSLSNEKTAQPQKNVPPDGAKPTTMPSPLMAPKLLNPYRPEELVEGIKKAQGGDLKGAIEGFSTAIVKNPKNFFAYFYRAKAEIESGDNKSAMQDINQAISLKGNEAMYFYYRGKMYSDMGESGLALLDFNKAISLHHDFYDAYNYRGVEKAKMGNHPAAIRDYDSAILMNPTYPLSIYNKGTSQAALGDYKSAIESLTKSIGLDSKHLLSYLNRGNCYVQLGNYKDAIADYTSVIKLDPKNADAYYNRGAAYFLMGDKSMCADWKMAASLGNAKAKSMLAENCK